VVYVVEGKDIRHTSIEHAARTLSRDKQDNDS
jgi:hypothetical protein